MSEALPCLRLDLDFMPSPAPDRPGLFIRDPHQYSDAQLIIPPGLVECLRFFDGQQTKLDLRAHLVQLTGSIEVGELETHLVSTLSEAGFLDDEVYRHKRDARHQGFRDSPVREAIHAGAAYPADPEPLNEMFARYRNECGISSKVNGVSAIAAPHVSPEGGWRMFGAAYNAIPPARDERVFVILGTSHNGTPEKFGLTRKSFRTPLGDAVTETRLVDRLAERAPAAVEMEDYCHATEHSIEFQVVFLQHLFGPDIRILPILVGSFANRIYKGGKPEDNDAVRGFFGELAEIAASESERLFWVLGVDMAHMGRRYGDSFRAVSGEGVMAEVAARDEQRIERLCAGDADGFWDLICERQNDLKWCGADTFYTFLRSAPSARGRKLGYDQWNIDEESVVSFGAAAFTT